MCRVKLSGRNLHELQIKENVHAGFPDILVLFMIYANLCDIKRNEMIMIPVNLSLTHVRPLFTHVLQFSCSKQG